MHTLSALVVAGLLSACPSGTGDPDGGEPDVGPVDGTELFDLVMWDNQATAFDVVDDAEVPLVLGFQGGFMLRPVFYVKDDAGIDEGEQFRITLTHSADPDFPDAFHVEAQYQETSFVVQTFMDDAAGRLRMGPLNDLLSFDWLPDERMIIEARLTSDTVDAVMAYSIALVEEDFGDHPCVDYAPGLGSDTCVYATTPATFTVTSTMAGSATADCADTLVLTGDLGLPADNADAVEACAEDTIAGNMWGTSMTSDVSFNPACLSAAGIDVDSVLDIEVEFEVEGTCAPGPYLHFTQPPAQACLCGVP